MSNVPAIDVVKLNELLNSSEPPMVIDVREKWENELCQIPTSTLMPLGQLPDNLNNVPKDRMVVLHCHHGGRSGRATGYLIQQGYTNVYNLSGGIHAWSEKIDPTVKTYT